MVKYIPTNTAAKDEDLLTECTLKISVHMPQASNQRSYISHLAAVLEHTTLCGLTIATSSLVPQRVSSILMFL